MEGPAILATAVPGTGQWFPQRVEVVGHQIVELVDNFLRQRSSTIIVQIFFLLFSIVTAS